MQTSIDLRTSFNNATEAFEYWLEIIRHSGIKFQNTKALFNVGFWLENPLDNIVYHREILLVIFMVKYLKYGKR